MSKRVEKHRITCPNCLIGFGILTIQRNGTQLTYDREDHPKCKTCGKFFKIKPVLQLTGVLLDEDTPARKIEVPNVRTN